MTMINQRTRTAYHEAGHAVVCAALGPRVYQVTIVPHGTFNGSTTHNNTSWCDHITAILLAGGLAVWELGWRRGEQLPDTCGRDLAAFDERMEMWSHYDGSYHPSEREQQGEYQSGKALALQTLSDYWGAVEAVAAALLEHGTIRGSLVHAIVNEHKRLAELKQEQQCN